VVAGARGRLPLDLLERNDFWSGLGARLHRTEQRRLPLLRCDLSDRLLTSNDVFFRDSVFVTMQRQRSRPDVIGRRRNHDPGQPSPAPEATMIVLAIAETTKFAAHLYYVICLPAT
jgi:hypothetical protein